MRSVTVHDEAAVRLSDLGSNCFLVESDVGKQTRASASVERLRLLNPSVQVAGFSGKLRSEVFENFDLVCFTDCYDRQALIEVNEFCRSRNPSIGFIWTGTLGLFGWTFVDFGSAHTVTDPDGEECKSTAVLNMSRQTDCLVTVADECEHSFQDGDFVVFREVEGMTQVNERVFRVRVKNRHSFWIGDTSQFSEYTGNGLVEQVKLPATLAFCSLRSALDTLPDAEEEWRFLLDTDTESSMKAFDGHFLLNRMLDFFAAHKRLPALLSDQDADAFEELCSRELELLKTKPQADDLRRSQRGQALQLPTSLARRVALFAETNLSPTSSFWGGVAAQEIMKKTGKFTPIRSWLFHETFSQVASEVASNKRESLEDSRHRDQIALLGIEAQRRLESLRVFLVGTGALGCEYLKLFVLMGVGCSDGNITITDDDKVEVSNLSSQFLFRKEQVGAAKSRAAVEAVRKMNPASNFTAFEVRVCSESEETFTDEFWDGLDLVVGAVDNVASRKYLDEKCVLHSKPMLEAGTLGTNGNLLVVLPNLTQSYSDSNDTSEDLINFNFMKTNRLPFLPEHIISWSKDLFESQFEEVSSEIYKFVTNPSLYIAAERETAKKQTHQSIQKLEGLLKLEGIFRENASVRSLVLYGRHLFEELFHDRIARLLQAFPADYTTEQGLPFWRATKRLPQVMQFDADQDLHLMFIRSTCKILAACFGRSFAESDESLRAILHNAVANVAEPTRGVSRNQADAQKPAAEDSDQETVEILVATLDSVSSAGAASQKRRFDSQANQVRER